MATAIFTIGDDLAGFEMVMPRVLDFLGAQPVPSIVAYGARVAAEELVVNVIRYGFDDRAPSHAISLEIRVEDNRVVVLVEDNGRPFDPRSVPEPDLVGSVESRQSGGWGVHLVRSMSKAMRYERRGGRNHVEVEIPFGE